MAKRSKKSSERGIALLLAIFTLMMLSALGLALLGAADLETQIAANYRDKQSSIYASLSGLQEARDRLIPSLCQSGSCPAPAIDTRTLDLPSTTAKNVVYILNPDTAHGETVSDIKPWDPNNKYYDSDLCSTSYFAANLCTGGVPPTTSNWYEAYDDSDSAKGSYYTPGFSSALPTPMHFKWVRITLKADNMTAMPARWSSGPTDASSGTQMCWQGSYEVPTTGGPGYTSACQSGGSVMLYYNGAQCNPTCDFSSSPLGSGFTNPTNVTISAPTSGTTATASMVLTSVNDGRIASVNITNPGSGYVTAPTVTIAPPASGTQATAIAHIGGAPIQSYTVAPQSDPIGCYSGTPTVSVAGGYGTGATAVASMTGATCIASWSVGVASGCTGASQKGKKISVTGTGGSGSNFAADITFASAGGAITNAVITDPGTGYSTAPTGVTANGNKLNGCTLNITWTLGTQVNAVNPVTTGSGYTSGAGLPTVSIAAPNQPTGQNAPSVTPVLGAASGVGTVTSITLTNPGSGYASAPAVTLSAPPSGTTATATATPSMTNAVQSITLNNSGSGYTSNPTVSVTGGTLPGTLKATASQSTLGRIYVLTSMAINTGGSKTLSQMEVATPPFVPFTTPAPLTLDDPNPSITPANSNNYVISGLDANSCGETTTPPKPAVGVYDDPHNPTSPTAAECVTSILGGAQTASCPKDSGVKSNKYPGVNPSPDVENVYNQLGDLTTPAGVDALATMIESQADYSYFPPYGTAQTNINLGTPTSSPPNCPTKVIYGDLSLGPVTGCGVLLVTGNLTMSGNFTWDGPIFVIGYGGSFTASGGGGGIINGSLFVAKDQSIVLDGGGNPVLNSNGTVATAMTATLQPPTVNMFTVSGGGNGIQYDHCWSDNMMSSLSNPAKSSKPLKVLSLHTMY